jgi:hypothetical protein
MAARDMDVIITGVEKETVTDRGIGIVYYGFPVGDLGIRSWEVPRSSTFDLNKLEVGKRYIVKSIEIGVVTYFNRKTRKMASKPEYDWVSVHEIPPKARTTTMSAQRSAAAKQAASMPWADGGDLFKWK